MSANIKKHSSKDRNMYVHNFPQRSAFTDRKCEVSVIRFGKVGYDHKMVRTNDVDIHFTLYRFVDGHMSVSLCGNIWNSQRTDYLECGQCYDTIERLAYQFPPESRKVIKQLLKIWRKWHLRKDTPANVIALHEKLYKLDGKFFDVPVTKEVSEIFEGLEK